MDVDDDATLRAATRDDTDAIRLVAGQAWHDTYDTILGSNTVETVLDQWYRPVELAGAVTDPSQLFTVVESAGDVVGFANAGPDRGFASSFALYRIYLLADHRRRGIGRRLLARTVDALRTREADRLKLAVLAANEPGVNFYEACGFDRVDTRPERIGDSRHVAHHYVRPL